MHQSWAHIVLGLLGDGAKYLVAAAAGWALKVGRDRWKTRRARAFWRPFILDDLRIVIGRFGQFQRFERSGLIGVGDARALAELQRSLAKIGMNNPSVRYADELHGDELKHTIIALGGPDANAVTCQALNRIRSKLRFSSLRMDRIVIEDSASAPPDLYIPSEPDAGGATTDYGLILRAPNPFAPEKEIMIMAGSYGHGTLACTRFAFLPEFLALRGAKSKNPFECLVKTDVVLDAPQAIRLILLRSIQSRA
jgi:hypothetical protein